MLDRTLSKHRLPPSDRALIHEMCAGVLRWRSTLDWLIDRQSRQHEPTTSVRVLLRLGLYQLFWLDRVPPHAAVHETVEAAYALDLRSQAGFVNAVLRHYSRVLEETKALLKDLRTSDPALGWSHPKWIVERWLPRLTPEELQSTLAWNNSPASTYARINTLKADPGQVIDAWRKEGVDYDFDRRDWFPENTVFRLRRHPPLERLRSLQEGWFYVQDPSTLLAVHVLQPQPGERLLDLCAAPGGKTTYLAQSIDNDGTIVAAEPDARRRGRLLDNVQRLAADVQVVAPEDPATQGPFDGILVDAPCSNTGVLRRRLDARWRLTHQDVERCRKAQAQLLTSALARLRPGGRLVYSTCSLEPDENEELVVAVLALHPHVKLESSRLLHPARDQVDGAFAALLRDQRT